MIEAEILKDATHPGGRITTFKWTYPRSILAEVNTHLIASKNTASSRAIPVKKRIQSVRQNPAIPPFWGENKPGMVADVESENAAAAERLWPDTASFVCAQAETMDLLKIHKQIINRMIEPWTHITQVFTTCDVGNLFSLRCSAESDPIFDVLMGKTIRSYLESEPQRLYPGEWYIPFDIGSAAAKECLKDESTYQAVWDFAQTYLIHGGFEGWGGKGQYNALKTLRLPTIHATETLTEFASNDLMQTLVRLLVSVSLCARVSYETHDRNYTVPESVEHVVSKVIRPGHPSPAQHQGQIVDPLAIRNTYALVENLAPDWSKDKERCFYDITSGYYWWGNFCGVRQLRKLLRGELRTMNPSQMVDTLTAFEKRAKERGYKL